MPELSLEAILAIIGIIVAIFIPCAFFFLRRYLKYKEIYNKYYSTIWKRFFSLKPEDLIGRRRFHKYYYERPEDIRVQRCLKQNKKIFLKGKPLSGKSRSIYQALMKSEKHYDVLIPRCVDIEHQDFIIPKHIKFWRPKVIIIDDMHEFVEKQNFKYLIEKCLQNSTNLIASCRSGGEFEKVQSKMTQFNLDLQFIFENNIIDIKGISEKEGKKIAEKVGITWETVGFNRTVGSIFMELPEMKRRFTEDCDEKEKYILRSIKKLYNCGIYEEFQQFPINWIIEIGKRDKSRIKENELYNILEKLQNREFLKIEENKKISIEQVYLEKIVKYQYRIPTYDLFEGTLQKFFDAKLPTPIWNLGVRSLSLSNVSSYDQKEFFNLSVKAAENIIKIYSLNESLIENDIDGVILGHLLFTILYMFNRKGIDANKKSEIFQKITHQSDVILTINPKILTVLHNKGYALQHLKRFKEANESYDQLLKIDPKYGLVYIDKAMVLIELEKPDMAIEYLEKASDLYPEDFTIWYRKGLIYGILERFKDAIESLNMAHLIKPEDKEVMYWDGLFYGKLGEHKEVIEILGELLEIDPEYKDAWKKIGESHHNMKAYNEAINCYDKALEIDPENKEIWYNKSKSLNLLGEFEEAIKCCDEALKIDPKYKDALCKKGLLFYHLKNVDKSISYFDKALKIDPKFTYALVLKGSLFSELKKHKEALKYYDRALETDPNNKVAWYGKGVLYSELKKNNEALKYYDRALEIDPEYVDAWLYKGRVLYNSKEYKKSINCFNKVLADDPNNFIALESKGLSLTYIGEYNEANVCFNKALEINPDKGNLFYNKACMESLRNNKEGAIKFLQRAIELNNDYKGMAKSDPDFENVKNTIEFKDLIEEKILLEQI